LPSAASARALACSQEDRQRDREVEEGRIGVYWQQQLRSRLKVLNALE
jgi:hypothetical protein